MTPQVISNMEKPFGGNKKSQKNLNIKRLSCDNESEDLIRKTIQKRESVIITP